MDHVFLKRWPSLAAAALFCVAAAPLAHAAPAMNETDGASVVSLGASHCVSLGVRQRGNTARSMIAMPTLSNSCDYPVVVAYCVDSSGRDPRACDAVDARPTTSRRLEAHETVVLDTRGTIALNSDINWAACRALPGVASGLRDGGSSGYCSAPSALIARQSS